MNFAKAGLRRMRRVACKGPVSGKEGGGEEGGGGGGGGWLMGSGKRPLTLTVCMWDAKWNTEGLYCSVPFPPLSSLLVFTAYSSPLPLALSHIPGPIHPKKLPALICKVSKKKPRNACRSVCESFTVFLLLIFADNR